MKDVSGRLKQVLSEGDAKRAQIQFFVDDWERRINA